MKLIGLCSQQLRKKGESLSDFMQEWKKLTRTDKEDLTHWLQDEGFEVTS